MSQNSMKASIYIPVMKLFKQAEFEPYVLYGFLITAVLTDKFWPILMDWGGGH